MTLIITLLLVFAFLFAARWAFMRQLRNWRDNANFRTVRGQATIKQCNYWLDIFNGYGIFKPRAKTANTDRGN